MIKEFKNSEYYTLFFFYRLITMRIYLSITIVIESIQNRFGGNPGSKD